MKRGTVKEQAREKKILIHKAVSKSRLQTPIKKHTNPKLLLKLHKKM